jgi:hypothetical protein
VLVLGLVGRQFGKISKRGEMPIVFSERLQQGEAMMITHLPPERRGRGRPRAG